MGGIFTHVYRNELSFGSIFMAKIIKILFEDQWSKNEKTDRKFSEGAYKDARN